MRPKAVVCSVKGRERVSQLSEERGAVIGSQGFGACLVCLHEDGMFLLKKMNQKLPIANCRKIGNGILCFV